MSSKSINARGVALSYVEKYPEGELTLFFIHGNSESADTFRKQMEDVLLSKFRLIAIDLPGHGNSAYSADPQNDYSPVGTALILADAIKVLAQDTPYVLVGFCYGSNLVAEMVGAGLQPVGVVLITPNIVGAEVNPSQLFKPNAHLHIFFQEHPAPEDIRNFLVSEHINDANEMENIAGTFQLNDASFRTVLARCVQNQQYSDETGILKASQVPVLCLFGARDTVVNTAYLNAFAPAWQIVFIEGAGHYLHLQAPREISKRVFEFVRKIMLNKTPAS